MRFLNQTTTKMLAVGLVTGAMGLSAGLALAAQPDMEGALHALESAQAHLNKVSQDKGGHANTARNWSLTRSMKFKRGLNSDARKESNSFV